jgi:hypothetical protein
LGAVCHSSSRFFQLLAQGLVEFFVKPGADGCASQRHEVIVLARLA